MEKYISVLKSSQLFSGLADEEISAMLGCLGTRLRHCKKGDYVLRQGDEVNDIMLLCEGGLIIQKDDYWGNRSILGHIAPGDMFGEAYIAPQSGPMLNDVLAVENSAVMYFDLRRVISTCSNACRFHAMVVQNMFYAISEKNRNLVQKLGHMSKRSTREKLISYLSEQARRSKSPDFTIPFNRQQLADFLSVDRSAMSNELCKMRDEGMLRFDRSHFTLL